MSIKGFLPLEITLPAAANLPESTHICYLKPHLSKNENEQTETTSSIFLINPLPCWNLNNVKKLFKQINTSCHVENVLVRESVDNSRISSIGSGINYDLHINLSILTNEEFGNELSAEERLPFGSSVIKFLDRDSFELFLTSLKKVNNKKLIYEFNKEDTGSGKYSKVVYEDKELLEKQVTKNLIEFQNREKIATEELENMRTIVDDDGFTLVIGSQNKTKADILGTMKKKADLEKDTEHVKKEKKKEKQDFYRFQIRERKKNEMSELLLKFRQDQQRVKAMKERRKFKPY